MRESQFIKILKDSQVIKELQDVSLTNVEPLQLIPNEDKEITIFNPFKVAIVLSLVYLFFSLLYVWVSSDLATQISKSIELKNIKGLLFALLTTLLFFIFTWYLLSRIVSNKLQIIRQRKQLFFLERRAIAGIFAASVSHDINNILIIAQAALDELSDSEWNEQDKKQFLTDTRITIKTIADLAVSLQRFGKKSLQDEPIETNLVTVVSEVCRFANDYIKRSECSLTIKSPKEVAFKGNPDIVQQMLLNLIINASEATVEEGKIEIRLQIENGKAILEIHDNRPGVPEENLDKVATDFYTTKTQVSDLGLLSLKACAEVHKGSFVIEKSDLGGACFKISVPSLTI